MCVHVLTALNAISRMPFFAYPHICARIYAYKQTHLSECLEYFAVKHRTHTRARALCTIDYPGEVQYSLV